MTFAHLSGCPGFITPGTAWEMSLPLLYWILLGLCSAYVAWKGGAPERVAIVIAALASVFSALFVTQYLSVRLGNVEAGIFVVDLVTLAAFTVLALRADRYWPLWVTGFHLAGVATHAAMLLSPDMLPRVYMFVQALWSYPILLMILVGAIRHRDRLKRVGSDNSWSSLPASEPQPAK